MDSSEGHQGSNGGNRLNVFIERWEWFYVVYQYAEFYRINVNDVYEVNLIEFLNYLAFMKDKGVYDMELAREQMKYNARG